MKSLVIITTTIALISAAAIENKYDIHYDTHQSSVDSARSSMQERLAKLESQQRQYVSGGSENYVAGCASCIGSSSYNTRASSSSSQNRASSSSNGLSADYVGVGIVGNANDRLAASRYSSNIYGEQDDLQQRVVPADLNAVRSSAYHKAENSEEEEEDVQRTVGVGFYDANVNNDRYSYSQRRQQEQSESESRVSGSRGRVVPVVYVPADSASSASSHRHSAAASESERHEERRVVGQAVPINNYVSMAVRPGTATVLRVPVRVNYVPETNQNTASQSQYTAGTESNLQTRVQPGYRTTYYPGYSSSASSADRVSGSQQTEKLVNTDLTNYNSYNNLDSASQTRSNYDDTQQVQERVSPFSRDEVQDSSSSASRHSSTVRGGGYSGVRVVPAFPVHTIESTSAQKTAEEREERRYSGSRPTYVVTDRLRPNYAVSSRTAGDESSSQLSSTGSTYYYPATSRNTQYQAQNQQQGSAAQTQYQAGSGSQGSGYMRTAYGGYPRPTVAPSASQLATRFGSGVVATSNDDLHQYMSESERLARIQQQQIAASSHNSAVSSVDEANRRTINNAQHLDAAAASFVGSGSRSLADRASDLNTVETFPGSNFKRVKSWSKQSKWASGSEYDTDGKIKSHSMLSTGESEKHNINGEEAKYAAATTTLENDGKVSTYSIHTP